MNRSQRAKAAVIVAAVATSLATGLATGSLRQLLTPRQGVCNWRHRIRIELGTGA
jgi:hypothetical protein